MKHLKNSALIAIFYSIAFGAFAAIPADVTTAMTDAKSDITTIGGLILGVCVLIFAYRKMSTTTKSS